MDNAKQAQPQSPSKKKEEEAYVLVKLPDGTRVEAHGPAAAVMAQRLLNQPVYTYWPYNQWWGNYAQNYVAQNAPGVLAHPTQDQYYGFRQGLGQEFNTYSQAAQNQGQGMSSPYPPSGQNQADPNATQTLGASLVASYVGVEGVKVVPGSGQDPTPHY